MIAPAQPVSTRDDLPDLLTPAECVAYLRLDALGGDAHERLRTLHRRQGLPRLKRGRLTLYRRSDIDRWLAGEQGGRRR